MARTRKDSDKNKRRDIEIIKLDGGCFDVLLRGESAYKQISKQTLNEILCIRFGYCGEEFKEILRELDIAGRKTILL